MATSEARPWWQPRWYELLPDVVLAIGLGFFLIDQTDAATSAFKSAFSVVLMLAVGVLWVAARLGAARGRVPPLARLAAFGVAAVVVLVVVVVPAYDDETVTETLAARAPAPESATPTAAPERVRTGAIAGIDHRAAGTAAIYRNADGSFVVGLEEIDIQPGPDYDLYVVPGADRDDLARAVRLGDLRGNKGTQYYDVPRGTDLTGGPWTVLVWCQTFRVPIANATPA